MSIIAIVQKKWHEMTILRFPVLPASGTLWTRGRIHWLTMPKNTRKQSSAPTAAPGRNRRNITWIYTWIAYHHIAFHLVPISQCLPKWLSCKRSHILTYFNHLYCTSQNHPSRPKRSHHPIPTTMFQRIFSSGTKRSHGSRNTEWQSSSRRMMSSTV